MNQPPDKHWTSDRPETDEQALELLRFGGVQNHVTAPEQFDIQRTERRMLACADYFEKRLRSQPSASETKDEARAILEVLVGLKLIKRRIEDGTVTPQDELIYNTTKEEVWRQAEALFPNLCDRTQPAEVGAPRFIVHESCEKHRGLAWSSVAPVLSAPVVKVCPVCETERTPGPDNGEKHG